jgi:type IV secretion system protein VirD4
MQNAPRPSTPASSRPLIALVVGCFVFACWTGTQFVAHRLGYHRALGASAYVPTTVVRQRWLVAAAGLVLTSLVAALTLRRCRLRAPVVAALLVCALGALIVSVGPVYAPHRIITWALQFEHDRRLERVLLPGIWLVGAVFVLGVLLLFAARPRALAVGPSTSHGSARWADGEELVLPTGLMLGRIRAEGTRQALRGQRLDVLRYGGEGHVITVAPTRSGKGVGCVIPNLLTYPGSVIVTDPKGENYAVTARQRGQMGHDVHALDPFDVVGGCATFNPLDLVDPSSVDAVDDARLLADMLVIVEGKATSDLSFWNEEARGLLTGLVLHVAANAPPELRTLTHVRELLTLAPEPFGVVMKDMLASDAADGLVSRAAARLVQKAERERSGVISAAQSHTHFLDSPRMARVLGSTSAPIFDVKRAPMSVYLVLPPERMDGYARWLRLMIAASLLAVVRTPGQPRHRVLFMLDEFAHLGRMQPVERDIGLAGGYGATFWLLIQDLAQLKATYPDRWPTFLANCDVLQTFGTNDWDTADYFSKLTGETTIRVASENRSAGVSRGQHSQRQEGSALNLAERGRRLLTPDEVLRLQRDDELLFLRGRNPVIARRLDYRQDAALAALADANPMHAVDTREVSTTYMAGH